MTTYTASDVTELAAGLRSLIEDSDDGSHDAAIRAVCRAIAESGADLDIEQDDDGADALNGGDYPLWVVSTHRLTVAGDMVAEWTRCAMGDYGAGSHERHDSDSWRVVEDTNGGDRLPDAVAVALDALGLEDDIPDVEEPDASAEVEDGEYAVLHKNDYAVSGGRDAWGVVSRHESEDDARQACEACWRGFAAATTQGSYGPEWCVGVLEDGEWVPLPDDA